jgi:hypothetical protein
LTLNPPPPPLPSLSRESDAEGRRIRGIAKRDTIPGHELQYRSGPTVPAV